MNDRTDPTADFLLFLEDNFASWKEHDLIDELVLENKADKLIQSIINNWSGVPLYVRKTGYVTRRDKKIYDEFDGRPRTIKKLALKYHLTERYIYKIIERCQKEHVDKTQRPLF